MILETRKRQMVLLSEQLACAKADSRYMRVKAPFQMREPRLELRQPDAIFVRSTFCVLAGLIALRAAFSRRRG